MGKLKEIKRKRIYCKAFTVLAFRAYFDCIEKGGSIPVLGTKTPGTQYRGFLFEGVKSLLL
jgi:hypothetical protein